MSGRFPHSQTYNRGGLELFTQEEFASAQAAAEQELGIPPRDKRNSPANHVRRRVGARLFRRTMEILWTQRALRGQRCKTSTS